MKRFFSACAAVLLVAATPAPTPLPEIHWTRSQVEQLIRWMADAGNEALTPMAADVPALRAAAGSGDGETTDRLASAAAVRLLTALRQGCCNASLRTGWHIGEGQNWPDARTALAQALAEDRLDLLFAQARPSHSYYEALRAAYVGETDPARRATLAANLDRWRWMPRDLGARYLLVNTAAQEATLWEGGREVGRWEVIVGKTKSPTPIFQTNVTGVTFNPWWEIPASIAKESVIGLFAKNPAEAARRGYVRQGGQYRQRPGPNNSLGRMKLVMPNRFSIYLHDTPAQSLFAQTTRTFSHGCVRVGDALGLATTLLGLSGSWLQSDTDEAVASGETRTVSLTVPVPVYVAYFTAEPADTGAIRYFKDVYRRDKGAAAPSDGGTCL